MIDTVVELSKINPYKKVNEITREERNEPSKTPKKTLLLQYLDLDQ